MPPPAYPLVGPGVRRLLVFFVLILGTLVASAQTLTQLRNTGPRDRRMNIVFVAEAFTANQEAEFNRQVDVISNAFIADEAYARFAGYINTFRLFVASNEAGPDEPERGIAHDTYFGSYISGGQLSVSDLSRFQRVLGEQIPDFDLAILIVNLGTAQPDRSGFAYINSGLAFIGSHSNDLNSAALTALHEAGHAFAGLYDEYAYATPSATQAPATVNVVNVSSASDRSQVSWSRFVLPGTPTPTNDAWYSDLGLDAVGTYAGAWYRSDLYRPTSNSRMRILNGPWGPVNLRAIASAMHRLNLESPTGPPTIVQQPSAADVAVGQALTLTVQASGTGPISYQWMRDSRFLDKGHQSTFTIPAMSRQDAGVYAVDVTNAFGSVTSVNVTVTVHDGADGHWSDQDIGAVGVSGMAVDAGATKTLRGSGSDIWDAADEFHFLYQTLSGDGSITARLTQFWINHYVNFAKAGLMFRDSLQANARHASVLYHLAYGRALQYRSTVGGQSGSSPFGTPGPGWLRLTRTGDTFTAYDSSDGVSWQLVASVTITGMPATLYVGLATTAHDDSQLLTAEFKNVAIATGATGTPIPPSGLSAAAISANQINLAWTDASTNETGFEIERAQGSGAFARIATVGANTTSYTDTTVAGSTTYSYRVRATGSTGPSAYSGTATATTPVTPPTSGDWNSRDVGTNLGRAGSSSDDAGTITVHGAGADIWERNDAFHYRYRGWSGDGEFIAHVNVLTNPNSWAKAGLMIRESLDANSRHALMCVSAGHGTAFQYRTQTGLDTSSSTATETGGTVQWVRLVRAGSTITGYASPDGVTWTLAGSTTIAFPTDVYVGFAVTSHNTTALCDARFDNVSFRGSGTPPPPSTPLPAPSSLGATAVSSTRISLTWTDNSSDEDGFEVELSTDGTTFVRQASVAANTTVYESQGLTPETVYTYRVRATRGTDRSAYSGPASAMTPASPPPANLSANVISTSRIDLSWTDPATNETGFQIERSSGGSAFALIGSVAANVTSFSDTTVTASTTYGYRVRANYAGSNSAYSIEAWATTPTPSLPAPSNLAATPIWPDQIHLTWTDNSSDETRFEVERAEDGHTFFWIGNVDPNTTSFTATGLARGVTYSFRVRATRGPDLSAYSATASATTLTAPPLTAPTNLAAFVASSTQIDLGWSRSNVGEDGYAVERSTDGVTFVQIGTVGATVMNFSSTGLTPATSYTFRIRATRGAERSPYSNTASATTPAGALATPTNLSATAVSSSRINLTWTNPNAGEIAARIYRATGGGDFTAIGSANPGVTTYSDTTVEPATTYTYRVLADYGTNRSGFSNDASATTAPLPVPAPTSLSATAVSSGRINLTWTDPGTTESGFRLERSSGTSTFTEIANLVANVTSYSDTFVDAGTSYTYRVRAYYGGSNYSAYSNEATASTPAGPTPPPTPASLTATAVSSTRVNLTWTDTGTGEDGFRIERAVGSSATFTVIGLVGANVTTFADTGVVASTLYRYHVQSTAGSTLSAYSNEASIVTPAAPPPAPTNLTATAISSTRIDLSWTDAGTTEDGFRIERVVGADSFAEIATVGANITTFSDTNVTANVTYEYRVRAIYGTTNSEYSNQASATPPAPPPPPPPPTDWLRADIGAVGIAGSDDMTANPAVIRGSGSDIWEGADGFHFVYRSLSGDGSIVARVTGISNTNAWAKAGVMIRESLAVGARNTFVLLSAGNGMAAQNRAATGGATTSTPNGVWGQVAPQWVRLTRTGNTVTTEWSSNGTSWSPIASFTVGFGADALIGLAVTSHNNGALCTANFTDVGVTGGTPPPPPPPAPPAAPTTLTATATSSSAIALAWTDASSNETGFEVERSTDSIAFTARTTTAAGATSFADSGLAASSTYYYRVRAVNAAGASGYSNTASAVTQAMPPPPPPPTPPAAPTGLSATVSSSSAIALAWTDASNNETGFEVERSTDNAIFSLRTTTTAGATTFNDTGLTAATTFYYRVRAVNAAGNSSYSNTATARTSDAPPPPPATWDTRDIGAVARAGSVAAIDGGIALSGSGEDIWNNADEFRYYYQAMTGDGELIARVTGLTNTNGWAKAGVMFRESLNANAAHAFMCVSIDHGTSFQYRAATGGDSATSTPSEVAGAIRWVRLVRTGNTIASYESENGTTWTPVMTRTFSFPTTIFVGLAVTSHNDGTNATATFTNITLTTGSTPPPPPPPPPATVNAPSALSATAASSTQINLAWTDNATNETGFEIERGVGSGSFSTLAAVGADRTGYSDTTVTAGTTYSYRVRAVAGSVTSAYSNSASATPTATPPPPPPTTWSFGDIGGVGVTGSNTSDSNSITVRGSGSDIWERADGFRFVYRAMTGDGVVEAQVTSIQNTNGWAKAGVMIRESLAAGSSNAAAFVSSEHGVVAQTRATTNGDTQSVAGSVASAPYWLRLTRSGNNFTAASSADGVTWTTFATFTIPMNATAYFGFAVTAHDNSQLNTAVFTDPSVH